MRYSSLKKICVNAKSASVPLSLVPTQDKNRALRAMAKALVRSAGRVIRENQKDVRAALRHGLPQSLVARLKLDRAEIGKIADSLISISRLPDPVGRVLSTTRRPNGLVIKKVAVPIGVILIIYESRPNVTADCMALCLKSGNSVILKGGSEALYSNRAIFGVLAQAAVRSGIPRGAFQLVATSDRPAVRTLLGFSEWIDLVIPRGGEGLIREVARISRIPVIKHTKGVCHVFVDRKADLKKSENIVVNAKVQNPAVCNAMETLLVHKDVAPRFIPRICRVLEEKGVEIRGDEKTKKLFPRARKATQRDWATEYLDLILAVRVVKGPKDAIGHIQKYGSRHSDAIVTEDKKVASLFTGAVDSACVFVNCSTRFNDGGEFGMGAEMGISTDKLHARGPMGLRELTSYKYLVFGHGQTRR